MSMSTWSWRSGAGLNEAAKEGESEKKSKPPERQRAVRRKKTAGMTQ
jgi:hypothetical protein